MNTKIILVRHAQSIKNLKGIHGGNGEPLTLRGKEQANFLAIKLLKIGINHENSIIVYPQNIQTKETAKIVLAKLDIPSYNIKDFTPLHLGIVHGLPNEIVATKYPQVFNLLQKWRNKDLEICDLTIPEMENPLEFYNRGLKVLNEVKKGKYNIFIATNSLYILLLNILLGNNCRKGGGYKHFNIPNCGITMFSEISEGNFMLNLKVTNVQDVILYKK